MRRWSGKEERGRWRRWRKRRRGDTRGGTGGGREEEDAMETEVVEEKEKAASEQGECSMYFFFNVGPLRTKTHYTVYVHV